MNCFFVIHGNPTPLARARINTNSFNTSRKKMWDCQKELKLVTAITLQNQLSSHGLFSGPLHLDIVFYMSIPKSKPKKIQDSLSGKFHAKTPDLSNLIKFVEDVSNGVLYKDDAIISQISAKKVYDNNPRTEFHLITL